MQLFYSHSASKQHGWCVCVGGGGTLAPSPVLASSPQDHPSLVSLSRKGEKQERYQADMYPELY